MDWLIAILGETGTAALLEYAATLAEGGTDDEAIVDALVEELAPVLDSLLPLDEVPVVGGVLESLDGPAIEAGLDWLLTTAADPDLHAEVRAWLAERSAARAARWADRIAWLDANDLGAVGAWLSALGLAEGLAESRAATPASPGASAASPLAVPGLLLGRRRPGRWLRTASWRRDRRVAAPEPTPETPAPESGGQ